jgi:peptide chain release factor 3
VTSRKQFQKGVEQLEEEGAMQLFTPHDGLRSEPIVAVVGELQFDVLQSRLASEYNVETAVERLSYKLARWVPMPVDDVAKLSLPSRTRLTTDTHGHAVVLFTSPWELDMAQKDNAGAEFLAAS